MICKGLFYRQFSLLSTLWVFVSKINILSLSKLLLLGFSSVKFNRSAKSKTSGILQIVVWLWFLYLYHFHIQFMIQCSQVSKVYQSKFYKKTKDTNFKIHVVKCGISIRSIVMMVKLHSQLNIQTHTSIPGSINFLRPAEPRIKPGTHELKDKGTNEKAKRGLPPFGLWH